MKRRQRSLKRPLIVQPLLLNLAILSVSFSVILALLLQFSVGGSVMDDTAATAAVRAVVRQNDGNLAVRMTPELATVRADTPGFWFMAADEAGHSISYGSVPTQYASLKGALPYLSYGEMRARSVPYDLSVVVRRVDAPAGSLSVLAHGKAAPMTPVVLLASNIVVIPIFLLLALASLIMTPWIVRRSLAGVSHIAEEARQIEIDRQGAQLSEGLAPVEIVPLVKAVNEALRRLDEGYHRQRRFIAAAAHELRTPIAILRVKIEAANDTTARKLSGDLARLSNLAEQLLDLHRIEDDRTSGRVALGSLVRHVVADIAPLFIAANKAIDVSVGHAASIVGHSGAIERVVTNLALNALEHGGQHVTVRVQGASVTVADDGPGIPVEERDRLFEPFQRLRPRSTGTGLGLHLVRQIVERHKGRVSVLDAPAGGTVIRAEFPNYEEMSASA